MNSNKEAIDDLKNQLNTITIKKVKTKIVNKDLEYIIASLDTDKSITPVKEKKIDSPTKKDVVWL